MEHSIRKAFLASQNPYRRLDTLWRNRVRKVAGGLEYLQLVANPKIFLHLIPVGEALFIFDRYDPQIFEIMRNLPQVFGGHSHYHRVNIDGFFGYRASSKVSSEILSYSQAFWDGSVEFCDAALLEHQQTGNNEVRQLHLPYFEDHLVKGLRATFPILKQFAVPLPIRICLAVIDAQGCAVTHARFPFSSEDHSIDRNELFLDPVMLDDWEADLGQLLRPLFDQFWNAGNFVRSFSYDESGNWKPNLR